MFDKIGAPGGDTPATIMDSSASEICVLRAGFGGDELQVQQHPFRVRQTGKIHQIGTITGASGTQRLTRIGNKLVLNQRQIAAGLAIGKRFFGEIHRQVNLRRLQPRLRRDFVRLGLCNFRRNFVTPDGQRHACLRPIEWRAVNLDGQARVEIRHAFLVGHRDTGFGGSHVGLHLP